ncbi:MAG: hypothetical protein K1X74_13650 [Pirellulales bacterium]|nr:hypothetical protein [Pirellulales bacterium]
MNDLSKLLATRLAAAQHWHLAPPADSAAPGDPSEWCRAIAASHTVLIKQGAGRATYRVESASQVMFVKHYTARSWRERLRCWLRGSASRREFEHASVLAARGIPAIRPLAWAERRARGSVAEHFFLSAALEQATSLDDYLAQRPHLDLAVRAQFDDRLVDGLATQCAAWHRAGVVHDDLHGGNLLVRTLADGTPRFFLVDLPGIQFAASLAWRPSRHLLAMLLSAMHLHATPAMLARFWERYRAERPELDGSDAPLEAQRIVKLAHGMALRLLDRRDRRVWRENREYYRVANRQGVAYAAASVPRERVASLLANPQAPFRAHRDAPIKISHSSLIVRGTENWGDSPWTLAYKRYRPRTTLKWLLALAGARAARRDWYWGHALAARKIATARPLVLVLPRHERSASYLVSEWITGAKNLHLWAWSLARHPRRQRHAAAQRCAVQLGELIGRLHAWNLAHRDLKGANLVVSETHGDLRCHLVDLKGLRRVRQISLRLRARNLARLLASASAHAWISRTIRLRFLQAYVRQQPQRDVCWKALWRAVDRESAAVLGRWREGESSARPSIATVDVARRSTQAPRRIAA